jgi:hypothetical protein
MEVDGTGRVRGLARMINGKGCEQCGPRSLVRTESIEAYRDGFASSAGSCSLSRAGAIHLLRRLRHARPSPYSGYVVLCASLCSLADVWTCYEQLLWKRAPCHCASKVKDVLRALPREALFRINGDAWTDG